jgi:hypothetical protein
MRRKRFWKKEMNGGAWFPDDPTRAQTSGFGGMFMVGKKKIVCIEK